MKGKITAQARTGINGFFFIISVFQKKSIKNKKTLAFPKIFLYTILCCDMIAMKREVAADDGRFSAERMSS